jgi:hypothetical protein
MRQGFPFTRKHIATFLEVFRRRAIDADGDIDAGLQAGFFDRLHD